MQWGKERVGGTDRVSLKQSITTCKRQLVGRCCVVQGTQPGVLCREDGMGGGWEGGRFKRVGTSVMFTIDSHCLMAETNTLQSNYPPFKTNFKKKENSGAGWRLSSYGHCLCWYTRVLSAEKPSLWTWLFSTFALIYRPLRLPFFHA